MHRLQLSRRTEFLLGGTLVVLGLVAVVRHHVVPIGNASLRPIGLDMTYGGNPFTGIVYDLHPNLRPYRVFVYAGGKRVAKEIHWYPDGGRWLERPYKNGLPHGDFRNWYEDGRIQSITHYVLGEPDGESWAWHRNGRVSQFVLYDRGREVSYKTWTFDGKPFYNYVYQNGLRVGVQGGEFCKARRTAFR